MDGQFHIGVGYVRSGPRRERYEFFLTLNGRPVAGEAPHARTVERHSDLQAEAVAALRAILRRRA